MVKRPTPNLSGLFRRIRAATRKRGARARLADVIGVLPPTLSDWLRGRYEPGGEVTLQLQKWVIEAEALQQKETAGALSTRQRRRPKKEKPREKKPSPGSPGT